MYKFVINHTFRVNGYRPDNEEEKNIIMKFTVFNPAVDDYHMIPETPGNYMIALKPGSGLPPCPVDYVMPEYNGLKIIYTGKHLSTSASVIIARISKGPQANPLSERALDAFGDMVSFLETKTILTMAR